MMSKTNRLLLLLPAVGLVALAGCGNPDRVDPSTLPPPPPAGNSSALPQRVPLPFEKGKAPPAQP